MGFRKMKKTILCIVALLLAVTTQGLFAQVPTPIGNSVAEVYKLTFTKFSLQDDAGTWHVVNDTPATVDIASTNVSGLARSIVGAAATVPAGHYKAFKSEVSGTMTIKGYWDDGAGNVYYTTSATVAVSAPPGSPVGTPDGRGIVVGIFGGNEAGFLATPPGDYAEGTIKPPTVEETFVGAQVDDEDVTVGVGADAPVTEAMNVDLSDTIQVWDLSGGSAPVPGGGPDGEGEVIFPGVPSIDIP